MNDILIVNLCRWAETRRQYQEEQFQAAGRKLREKYKTAENDLAEAVRQADLQGRRSSARARMLEIIISSVLQYYNIGRRAFEKQAQGAGWGNLEDPAIVIALMAQRKEFTSKDVGEYLECSSHKVAHLMRTPERLRFGRQADTGRLKELERNADRLGKKYSL